MSEPSSDALPRPSEQAQARAARLAPGAWIPSRKLRAISGSELELPDRQRLVHLQFRRFAGCPVCNLHLHSFAQRKCEIEKSGVREIVLFHASAEILRPHAADLPFDVVADPGKSLYREFGVESAPRALLDPRAWLPIARAVARSAGRILASRDRAPQPEGGRLGLPADFLIAPETSAAGRVLACKYGEYVYDQWSVDELLALTRAGGGRQRGFLEDMSTE